MKTYLMLGLIAILFAIASIGSLAPSPIFDNAESFNVVQPQASLAPTQEATTVVTKSLLGKEDCLDIYIGENIDLADYDVLALQPNYQERNDAETKPILFSRSLGRQSHISDIRLNSKYAEVDPYNKVLNWTPLDKKSPQEFLNSLTRVLQSTNLNIAATRYKIVPLDDDNFRLEDITIIYKKGYEWRDIEIVFETPDSSGESNYKKTMRYQPGNV